MNQYLFRLASRAQQILRFLLREMGRRNAIIVFLTQGLMSVLDLAGIALIFPFLKIVIDEGFARHLLERSNLGEAFASMGHAPLIIVLAISLAMFYLVKTAAQVWLVRLQMRILARSNARLADGLTSKVLNARYSTFQQTPASQLAGTISITPHASAVLVAIMQAASDILLLMLMLIGILLVNPTFALGGLLFGGLFAAGIYVFVTRRSAEIATEQRDQEIARYRLLFSIASAIRDIKIMGLEPHFEQRSSRVTQAQAELTWRLNLYHTLPRVAIELFALLGILGLALSVVLLEMPMSEAGPLLGLIAVATMRAVPAFSRLMGSLNVFGTSGQYVRMLMDLQAKLAGEAVTRNHDTLAFSDCIELHDVGFSYGSKEILANINLRLGRSESIGIVGSSGTGKTTLLDILTGLQQATSGRFTCDGVTFDPFTSHAMHSLVGYVPQAITLLDESIAFNVSFEEHPDRERVMGALKAANLADMVSALSEGIDTRLGENGLRCSGGQRQRIGIARALYRSPEILVFDEATSSLDTISEAQLIAEVEKLRSRLSIVIVAHRLSTVISCDRIYVMAGGQIEASGTHEDLLLTSETYKKLYASEL